MNQYPRMIFFLLAAGATLVWLLLALGMVPPAKLSNYIYRLHGQADADRLTQRLRGLAGVSEAVVVAEDGVAYLRVDRRLFDEASLP